MAFAQLLVVGESLCVCAECCQFGFVCFDKCQAFLEGDVVKVFCHGGALCFCFLFWSGRRGSNPRKEVEASIWG